MPEDLDIPADPDDPNGPRFVSEQDEWDAELDVLLGRNRFSRVDTLEWELWDGHDQDQAERELLRRSAPPWVLLPPGGDLASALEQTRPEAMSPMALIELMKAADRLTSWAEAIKATAMASFYRQRQAEHRESPRPTQLDTNGRPIDPERSWYAEIALALGLSPNTVGRPPRRHRPAAHLDPVGHPHRTAMRGPDLGQGLGDLRGHQPTARPRRPSGAGTRPETRPRPNPPEPAALAAPPGRQTHHP
ncbi:hypothetical protein ACIBG5_09025 [Kribbella sp. NPDC050241]|uniref:hypothetical protein n=1 Tax=Kribbella sp. NPDC050241 TaxID=3364115 RepID=UPI0037B837CD